MKNIILASLFVIICLTAFSQENDKEIIKKVIIESYQDGIGNNGDVEAVKKGFHPGFNLLIMKNNNTLENLPIYTWIELIKQKHDAGKYPSKEKITFKFPFIDVCGTAAVAKIEFFVGDYHRFTDYVSLYKFKEGWKIVNKIYTDHKK